MNRLTKEADESIRKVVARYNSLYSPSGSFSQIDFDLLMNDIRIMYDKFRELGNYFQQVQVKATPLEPARPQPPSPPLAAVQEKESISKPAEDQYIPETAPLEAEPSMDNSNLPIQEEKPEPEMDPSQKMLADQFRDEKKSLRDVIAQDTGNNDNLASKLGHSSVTDLRSVIGLAEKFAFINELFGGDPLAYEKSITQLNGSTRLAEADAYLGTLRLNHKWPNDSELALQFIDIVKRKFA